MIINYNYYYNYTMLINVIINFNCTQLLLINIFCILSMFGKYQKLSKSQIMHFRESVRFEQLLWSDNFIRYIFSSLIGVDLLHIYHDISSCSSFGGSSFQQSWGLFGRWLLWSRYFGPIRHWRAFFGKKNEFFLRNYVLFIITNHISATYAASIHFIRFSTNKWVSKW